MMSCLDQKLVLCCTHPIKPGVYVKFLGLRHSPKIVSLIVQELCESRGGRPGLSVLTSLMVSVDVKLY